jgi:hypothetical protein
MSTNRLSLPDDFIKALRGWQNYFMKDVSIEVHEQHFDESGTSFYEARGRYVAGQTRFKCTGLKADRSPRFEDGFLMGVDDQFFRIQPDENNTERVTKQFQLEGHDRYDNLMSYALFHLGYGADFTLFFIEPEVQIIAIDTVEWNGMQCDRITIERDVAGGVIERFYFDSANGWLMVGVERRKLKVNYAGWDTVRVEYDAYLKPVKLEHYRDDPVKGKTLLSRVDVVDFQKLQDGDELIPIEPYGLNVSAM